MSVFSQIIAGEQQRQARNEAQIQDMFQQFGAALGGAAKARQDEEIGHQMADAKFAALTKADPKIATPERMDQFANAKSADEKAAMLLGLETEMEMKRQKSQRDLEEENIRSQISLREAQALASMAKPRKTFRETIVDASGQPRKVVFDSETNEPIADLGAAQRVQQEASPEEKARGAGLMVRAKGTAESNQAIKQAGMNSANLIANTKRAINMLESGKLQTGALTNVRTAGVKVANAIPGMKSMAEKLGIDLDREMSQVELVEEFRGKVLPTAMETLSQLKGAVSDKEFSTILNASANPNNTPEANLKILKSVQKAAENAQKLSTKISKMQKEGKSVQEVEEAIFEFKNDPKNSIMEGIDDLAPQPTTIEASFDDIKSGKVKPNKGDTVVITMKDGSNVTKIYQGVK